MDAEFFQCVICQQELPEQLRSGQKKKRAYCRPCHASREKARRANNPNQRAQNRAHYALNSDRILQVRRVHRQKNPAKHYCWLLRSGAKKRGLLFSLTEQDLGTLLHERCPVCGVLYEHGTDRSKWRSFDRLDNDRGYVVGNVVALCYRCNRMKNDGTAEEHRRLADWLDRVKP